jgi:hypothetical protein
MPEVPQIVRERLRAGRPGSAHPDANVLAAFAEQSLAPAERAAMLDHLVLCEECRELLAVSVPPMEAVPQVVAPEPAIPAKATEKPTGLRLWFSWSRVAWAGLAAGVVVALGVLLMHPGQQGVDQALQKSRETPALPVAATDKSAPALASEIATRLENRAPVPPPAASPDLGKRMAKPPVPKPVPPKEQAVAQNIPAAAAAKDEKVERYALEVAGQPASTSESVEVTAGAGPIQMQTADAMARNESAPVVRAKAARASDAAAPEKAAETKPESASVQPEPRAAASGASPGMFRQSEAFKLAVPQSSQIPAQWAIRGDEVQRSLDSGAHWTAVFQPHRRLLCVASMNLDVWVGGKDGALFHSANSGETWNQVHPSVQDKTLTDDVTHIDLYGSARVVLVTGKMESWSTTDGGKTWEKK